MNWLETPFWKRDGNDLNDDARRLLREKGWDGEDRSADEICDSTKEEMREKPVDITKRAERSCWGDNGWRVTEVEFLLSTGGPAVRILARDHDGETASNAVLQCQDWYEPWRDVPTSCADDDVLDWFVGLFCIYCEG